ncbi:MAG: hypothetical protein ACK55Z_11035 [bacterium]
MIEHSRKVEEKEVRNMASSLQESPVAVFSLEFQAWVVSEELFSMSYDLPYNLLPNKDKLVSPLIFLGRMGVEWYYGCRSTKGS